MLNLPPIVIDQIDPFAPCFYGVTTWMKAQILLVGTILTPGKRVVTEALRVMGLSQSRQFAQYHQVLNRAIWSPLELAQVLLRMLVKTFVPAEQALSRRWSLGSTTRLNGAGGNRLVRAGFIAIRCALARAISLRPVACAGLA